MEIMAKTKKVNKQPDQLREIRRWIRMLERMDKKLGLALEQHGGIKIIPSYNSISSATGKKR